MQDDGLSLQLSRRLGAQCLGKPDYTNVRQNQVCDWIHKTCKRVASLEYVQEIFSIRYGMKA